MIACSFNVVGEGYSSNRDISYECEHVYKKGDDVRCVHLEGKFIGLNATQMIINADEYDNQYNIEIVIAPDECPLKKENK